MTLPKAFSYWQGPVTWMERLSCASAAAAGYDVTVFSYAPADLRAAGLGVHVEDARDVFEASCLAGINDRVPDHFSDWFRVEGLRQSLGVWFDLDMVLLRHLGSEPRLMAWERPQSICGAVLFLPPDCHVLADYVTFCRKRPVTYAPSWYPLHTRLRMHWKRAEKWLTGKAPPRLHYGPPALTHFVRANRLESCVLPQEIYYPFSPMSLDEMRVLVDGDAVVGHLHETTRAVHLWRSLYKRVNGMALPPGDSWLGRCARGYDLADRQAVSA